MDWKKVFRPSKTLIIILAALPVVALFSWVYLFTTNFSCPGSQDCFLPIKILIILEYFLIISPIIYIYLVIALIIYLASKVRK